MTKIILTVSGGLVQDIVSTEDIDVFIVDYDGDSHEIDGESAQIMQYTAKKSPDESNKWIKLINEAEEN